MSKQGVKLKRVEAGVYETRDGCYRITREPEAELGPAFQMGTGAAWWIHDQTAGAGDDALNVNDPCGRLWEARAWIEREVDHE
jgi:hypothetical protein